MDKGNIQSLMMKGYLYLVQPDPSILYLFLSIVWLDPPASIFVCSGKWNSSVQEQCIQVERPPVQLV